MDRGELADTCLRLAEDRITALTPAVRCALRMASDALRRQPSVEEVAEHLKDPNTVHINMLRGGIAKPTPAQIGHLYRGEEAGEVIREVARQNPEAARKIASLYGGEGG